MTSSAPPPGDEVGLEQEPIWSEPGDAGDGSDVGSGERPAPAEPDRGERRRLAESITSTSRVPGPAGLYYADVPNRIIAMIIDIIVLSLVGVGLSLMLGGLTSQPGALDSAGGELQVAPFLVALILQLVVSFAYFAYCWTVLQSTLGMRMLGLRIGDEADGAAMAWRQAAVRWLFLGVPSMLGSLGAFVPGLVGIFLTAVGFVWLAALLYTIAGSPTKQGLHDRAARTIVTRAARRLG